MEFHDNYPQYEVMSNHGEEEGKKGRRILWNVFWVMLFVTIFELIVGFLAPSKGWTGTWWIKTLFISLTIVKAGAIVLWFMHLGGEIKAFKYIVLLPYITFILYGLYIILTEGTYAGSSGKFTRVDPIFVEQQKQLHHKHSAGAASHDAAKNEAHGEHAH